LSVLKAVILIGGPGTRLQPLTDDRPKSVLPVLNKPFMEYTFAYLKKFGIEDIILTLNYLPDVIQEYLGDGSRYGVRLTYCFEKEPMGTAGAIKNVEEYLDDTFVTLNGDVFTDLDLNDMLALHRDNKAAATISLQWVDDPSAFGVVETDDTRRVKRFIEKPPLAEATTNWINAGIYILEPEVIKYIPENEHYMVERGLFPALLDMDSPVYGYPFHGYWLDMGTPYTYYRLNRDLLLENTLSPLSATTGMTHVEYGADCDIHSSARITAPVVIGSKCLIGRNVSITGPAVIGNDCTIENGAMVVDTLLWNNVRIGTDTELNHCIIGSDVSIGQEQQIKDCIVTSSATVMLPAKN
jgi:mannose-1-phosphate guanylyltransferase